VLQVLKEACLSFYYGNGKKALNVTDEFQDGIPVNGLILVAAVVGFDLINFIFLTDQCFTDEGCSHRLPQQWY
jgi:hypothetical protein